MAVNRTNMGGATLPSCIQSYQTPVTPVKGHSRERGGAILSHLSKLAVNRTNNMGAKNLKLTKTYLHSTCTKHKRCHDVTLSRKEVQCATWRMHSTRPPQPVETQDGFFYHLVGQSAPIGLANVHWFGCINTINRLTRLALSIGYNVLTQ